MDTYKITRENPITVTELNEYIKIIIDGAPLLSDVYIKGEISNFTNHRTGHFYFTLKDEGSLIKAVMFKSQAEKVKFKPTNGMKIVAHGRISAFPRDGQYQLYCTSMEPDGIGALYTAYEQLKETLAGEGLFDKEKKRALPKYPRVVGVITSPTGAAIRDIINILTRRFKYAKIILCPALVQGEKAPANLIAALKYFNSAAKADVIIIGRGGGSIEDLWAFNDEALAREVAASSIPVISAVGHETDFTICDFAADMRAPTPSAAAEIAVPDTSELLSKFESVEQMMKTRVDNRLKSDKTALANFANKRVLKSLDNIFEDKQMMVLQLERQLISQYKLRLNEKKQSFLVSSSKLNAYSPVNTLVRGYNIATGMDGEIINSTSQVKKGDQIQVRVSDGIFGAEVL